MVRVRSDSNLSLRRTQTSIPSEDSESPENQLDWTQPKNFVKKSSLSPNANTQYLQTDNRFASLDNAPQHVAFEQYPYLANNFRGEKDDRPSLSNHRLSFARCSNGAPRRKSTIMQDSCETDTNAQRSSGAATNSKRNRPSTIPDQRNQLEATHKSPGWQTRQRRL